MKNLLYNMVIPVLQSKIPMQLRPQVGSGFSGNQLVCTLAWKEG